MPASEKERPIPCNHCREKHLRCNGENPCANCAKSHRNCVRSRERIRFKKNARFKSNLGFSADQPWIRTKNTDRLSYVEVNPQSARQSKVTRTRESQNSQAKSTAPDPSDEDDGEDTESDDGITMENEQVQIESQLQPMPPPPPPPNLPGSHQRSNSFTNGIFAPASRLPAVSHLSPISPSAQSEGTLNARGNVTHQWQGEDLSFASPHSQRILADPSNLTRTLSSTTSLPSPVPSTALHGLPEGFTDEAYLQLQEACLLRHFVDNLASWFEITDRDRHFSIVVPQRAMYCPVLLYALYTASARHLTRLWQRKNPTKTVEFEGIPLPGLDERTAIRYHNICINYMIEISNDPAQSYNEDALTAATILRFYEQIDTPLTGEDSETYLNVVRAVVETQQDESFYAIRKIHGPIRDTDPYLSPAVSMRHSACLIAIRQEIWSVLLYRRPIQLPICPNNDYELIEAPPPADDFVWANRILVWTADVLKFCFGGLEIRNLEGTTNNPSPSLNINSRSRVQHWEALKRFETTWEIQQPATFKPVYYREADPSSELYFPEIWHVSDVQVLALQHVELAGMLLAVYDPRLPRLGLGASSLQRALETQVRRSTLRLCGLGLSNQKSPPAMVTAAVGISMCGEYFQDEGEQEAIVRFLVKLEDEHAWPTQAMVHALQDSWKQQRAPRS